jgi:hypothetical protein
MSHRRCATPRGFVPWRLGPGAPSTGPRWPASESDQIPPAAVTAVGAVACARSTSGCRGTNSFAQRQSRLPRSRRGRTPAAGPEVLRGPAEGRGRSIAADTGGIGGKMNLLKNRRIDFNDDQRVGLHRDGRHGTSQQ